MNFANMISIIIPLYNKERSIKATIDSVLAQTYINFELIIVNDGSIDNSVTIIEKFIDPRIKIYSKKNAGVSSARNYGINKAIGEYLFFLDADDIIYPDCLDILVQTAQAFPKAGLIIANFICKDLTENKTWVYCDRQKDGYIEEPFKSIWTNQIYPRAGALLIQTNLLNRNMQFDERVSRYEDMQLWMKLMQSNIAAFSSQVVHEYIKDSSGLSANLAPLKIEFAFYIKLKESKNIYEKKILANILYTSILGRIKAKEFVTAWILIRKNITDIHWLFWIGINGQLVRYKIINQN